jgi:hypothetical protein
MAYRKLIVGFSAAVGAALLTACASQPQPAPAQPVATPATAAPSSAAAEKDTASALEKRFRDAARSYKTVQKDGKTLYCKREKRIGTTIPTMNCLTESELRTQVEMTEEYRNRARNSSRCTHGAGCGAGS